MKKVDSGRLEITDAHTWFKRASDLPDIIPPGGRSYSQGNTWDFMKALVNLSLPTTATQVVPPTFLFDEERLMKLRSDLQDLINFEVSMYLYRHLDASSKTFESQAHFETVSETSLNFSPFQRPASPADTMDLSSPTIPSPHHFAKQQSLQPPSINLASRRRWSANLEDDCATSTASSSPYCSPASLASTPDTHPPTPLYLSNQAPDSTAQVRASLLAILSSSSSSNKWKEMAPALALQVLRSTPTPLSHLPRFEEFFCAQISNPNSRIYAEAESRILHELFPVLRGLVEKYTPLTSLQIFEAATSPKATPLFGASPPPQSTKDEIAEIATRIAHLGILHWRVWAPLAYLVEQDEDCQMPVERAQSMP